MEMEVRQKLIRREAVCKQKKQRQCPSHNINRGASQSEAQKWHRSSPINFVKRSVVFKVSSSITKAQAKTAMQAFRIVVSWQKEEFLNK